MTELEKLERARMYIDKLANGIDPISDTEAPDSDIINNIRLSRCFFYVSDILRQVIENGGTVPQKKEKKVPFSVSMDKLAEFEYSKNPISVSEIARRITSLSDCENMQQMKYTAITNWLTELGLLHTEDSPAGKRATRPTEKGIEMDITVAERTGLQGTYQVVVYGLKAQHFIIDNLDDIIRSENADGVQQGQPWSREDDECLEDLFQKGFPESAIAITLKRSTSSVHSRLRKLGY